MRHRLDAFREAHDATDFLVSAGSPWLRQALWDPVRHCAVCAVQYAAFLLAHVRSRQNDESSLQGCGGYRRGLQLVRTAPSDAVSDAVSGS